MLHLEETSNCNSDIWEKTWCVWLHFYVFSFYLSLINKCVYPVAFIKLLLKHSVYKTEIQIAKYTAPLVLEKGAL
jgi:hypothetical protein